MKSDDRMPNLFILGAPKCGTTMLANVLSNQPNIYMTRVKETGFFLLDRHYELGLDYYLRSYFPAGTGDYWLRGEATPWYLYSSAARERIMAACGQDVKLIIMLRSPVERAHSMFLDQERATSETRPFDVAIDSELDRLAGPSHPDEVVQRRYAWCGLYARAISPWFETFGRDRVHIGFLEHAHTDRFWADLATFLHLPHIENRSAPVESNAATPPRLVGLNKLLRSVEGHNLAAVRAARRVIPNGWDRRALQSLVNWNKSRTPASERATLAADTAQRLRSFFEQDRRDLEALLGSAPPWG